ncbi:MAG: hypothetical protein LBV06_03940 [Propionibacteriaceae bacterium]|jgi:hypothetical protein|nr:hypothetical protein [Propionibacteriaceae bacterium]
MALDHSLLNSWALAHTALLVEGQSRLSELIGTDSPDWEMNLDTGLLTLNGVRLHFALLGRVDESTDTWHWAWGESRWDRNMVAVHRSLPLRRFGEETQLWEFVEPSFSVEGIVDLGMTPAASVCLVASPQLMGGAVFSGASGAGRLYAVVTDPRLTMEPPSAFTAAGHVSGALPYVPDGHRDVITVYASAHQIPVTDEDGAMVLTFEDSSRLVVTFGADGRLAQLESAVAGAPAPSQVDIDDTSINVFTHEELTSADTSPASVDTSTDAMPAETIDAEDTTSTPVPSSAVAQTDEAAGGETAFSSLDAKSTESPDQSDGNAPGWQPSHPPVQPGSSTSGLQQSDVPAQDQPAEPLVAVVVSSTNAGQPTSDTPK